MKEISAEEFYQIWQEQSLAVLDVREVDEFVEGHIPASRNFPLSQLNELAHDLNQGEEYYLVCHSGKRSFMAAELLQNQGYQVVSVQGGVTAFPGELVEGE